MFQQDIPLFKGKEGIKEEEKKKSSKTEINARVCKPSQFTFVGSTRIRFGGVREGGIGGLHPYCSPGSAPGHR